MLVKASKGWDQMGQAMLWRISGVRIWGLGEGEALDSRVRTLCTFGLVCCLFVKVLLSYPYKKSRHHSDKVKCS